MTEHKYFVFTFADVEVREREFSIVKAGELLPVEPKAFRVLLFLLRSPHRLIKKDELLDAVWSDCAVSDNSLTRSIALLRRLLGDDTHEPRYIATVPTVGYRFLCDVKVVEDGFAGPNEASLRRQHNGNEASSNEFEPLQGTRSVEGPPHRPSDPLAAASAAGETSKRWKVIVPAAATMLAFLVAGYFYLHRVPHGPPILTEPSPESGSLVRAGTGDGNQSAGFGSPSPAAVPLTSDPGDEIQPSFSPEGDQVAYAFNEGDADHFHIWVKAIGSEQAVQLTSASYDDMSPAWSPDGESIAFIRLSSGTEAWVMIIPSSGGNERKLASIAVNLFHTDTTGVSWSPDGNWIATTDVNFSAMYRLILISIKTGLKQNLNYEPSKFDSDAEPSFSPDGRHLAFTRYISPSVADIFVLELPKEEGERVEARQRTHWNRWSGSPVWSADGQEILFIRKEAGIGSRIWRVAAYHDKDARLVESVGEGSRSIAFSATSNRLVYSNGASDPNIWRISLDSTSSAATPNHSVAPTRLIASTRADDQPQLSPDGRLIAFTSDRSGDPEIWLANSDGSGERQLTRLHAAISAGAHWSPNGKEIVFHSRPAGNANLYIVNVETGAYRQLTTGLTENYMPSWSHDGEWIYFGSGREGGEQIWKMPASGGPATRLTKSDGAIALESPDGRQIFYTKTTEPGLWMLSLESGIESKIVPNTVGFECFAMGKRGMYFERGGVASGFIISFMSFSDHVVRDLVTINAPVGDGLTVSPDERSIVYSQIDHSGSDLFLVQNFK